MNVLHITFKKSIRDYIMVSKQKNIHTNIHINMECHGVIFPIMSLIVVEEKIGN